jgi:hypothetical protein
MEPNERLVKMNPGEISLLEEVKKVRARGLGPVILWAIGFAALFGFLYETKLWREYWALFLIALVVIGAPIMSSGRSARRIKGKLNQHIDQDLEGGHKKVIARRIEKQNFSSEKDYKLSIDPDAALSMRSRSNRVIRYYMVIDGVLYSASEELFEETNEGGLINFHIAPNSGFTLCFTTEGDKNRIPCPPLSVKVSYSQDAIQIRALDVS